MPATHLALVNITSLGAWAANLLGRDQVPRPWEALSEFLLNERLRWYPDCCPETLLMCIEDRTRTCSMVLAEATGPSSGIAQACGIHSVCSSYQGGSICRESPALPWCCHCFAL